MDKDQLWALNNLSTTCVDDVFMSRTHGVSFPPQGQLADDLVKWSENAQLANKCRSGTTHRVTFELFLQSQDLLSINFAAARLGMTAASLASLLPLLPAIGLSKKYQLYDNVIDDSLAEDLTRSLRGLRFRTFGSHDSFCELLHHALYEAVQFKVERLMCATADSLGEQRMYASTWDNITFEPLSTKHSVWLDFKKPISLAPDRCSKLFYAKYREMLRPFLAGRQEPRDLAYYNRALGHNQ